MDRSRRPDSVVANAILATGAGASPSWYKLFFGTLLPPLVVLMAQFSFGPAPGRWSLFTPAVLACAWFGGFESGVVATLLSAALMWWFFAPPEHVMLKPAGPQYAIALAFICTGLSISAVFKRWHRDALLLARTHRLLEGIVEYSPNGIAIKNLERRYIILNKALEKLEGVKAEAALGRRPEDVLPPPLAQVVRDHEQQVLERHAPVFFESTLDVAGGRSVLITQFPVFDESQNVFALGAMVTDITQQKHDREALREGLAELRIAQHVSHVGSWRWDFRTNQTTWSDELYDIFGIDHRRSPEPLLAPGLKLLSAESIFRLSSAIDKLRTNGEPFELDLDFTRPDGAKRWCTARGEAIRDAEGRITGVAATAADVTHIMRLEQLREEWTSIIAHDLRQPIGVISNASELIPEMRDVPGDELSMLHRIQSAATTLKRMVDDLLDVSLLEARHLKLERKWLDPGALVRETVKRLEHVTGDRAKIAESGPRLSVCVDSMRIEQVIANLLANAAKYGEPEAPIEVRLEGGASEVRISITNHGKGIATDELPRLFDRFARSRTTSGSAVPGLGLGLYIAKEIVEAHGGRIWAESVPGKTTTFHIALPATMSRREAA